MLPKGLKAVLTGELEYFLKETSHPARFSDPECRDFLDAGRLCQEFPQSIEDTVHGGIIHVLGLLDVPWIIEVGLIEPDDIGR
jgi:hypothetical protein